MPGGCDRRSLENDRCPDGSLGHHNFICNCIDNQEAIMRKQVKNNVSWIGYMDWELKTFHGDEYSIMNGSSSL